MDDTESASTLTGTLEVVNGSASLIGSFPKLFVGFVCRRRSPKCRPNAQTVIRPSTSHSSPWSCGSNGVLVSDTTPMYSVCTVLSCPSSALLEDDTMEGLDCSSLTLGKAYVVTCAGGHTAVEDSEIRTTRVFDLELASTLREDSAHSCKWASCDLSTLAPPSTSNHDCLETVFGKSCVVNCSYAISGTAAFAELAGGQYFTCDALTCFIGDHWLNCSLSGSDCASWIMGRGRGGKLRRDVRGRVPGSERNQGDFDVGVR